MIKLPKGITLEKLKKNWDTANKAYGPIFKRIRILDGTDRGSMWKVLNSRMPEYQILPDTNHVTYVKNNLLASVYSVAKSAELAATTEEDKEVVMHLNIWLNHYWNKADVKHMQYLAGERAALTNLGITQVGWSEEGAILDPFEADTQGPTFKNIDPTQFMRDPSAPNLDAAAYCMTWENLHEEVLKDMPIYADTIEQALKDLNTSETPFPIELLTDRNKKSGNKDGYHMIITHWIKHNKKISEIHTIDNKVILKVVEDLKPNAFPFAMLFCNVPVGDLIGSSEPFKIWPNSFAYNFGNSMLMTAEYKNQRPPKYVDVNSGVSVPALAKYGNDPDATFPVRGDASRAIHYHQFPQISPTLPATMGNLFNDIQRVTGIDERYTGNSTGSILTTGGMEAALGQATLIDAVKIENYERYTRRLTQLTLANMVEHSPSRDYFIKEPNTGDYAALTIDFPKIKKKKAVFSYAVDISSELPRNKSRRAETANILMEKQMQYSQSGQQVELITPEEWAEMQDLPNKERMLERMRIQRHADYVEQVSRILTLYAGLAQSGMDPSEALQITAQDFAASRDPNIPPPEAMMQQEAMAMPPDDGMSLPLDMNEPIM